jgi:glucose-6-phosphate 1-dehydrogenase
VIFGVTGDLSRKKLMPAVYDLANRGLLPPGFALVGFARRDWEDQDFAQIVHDSVKEHARTEFREEVWQQLAEGIRFVQGDFDDDDAFEQLRQTVEELDVERGTGGNHAFYLSVPPKFFPWSCKQLKKHGLAESVEDAWRRVVIEKPFGHDLQSARELNDVVSTRVPPDSSSASTTTSARRRSRTSSRCGSPTRCSSRSGTPTTSTTCRSRWPRTSASAAAPATTTASARRATSSRTTCCS